MEIKERIQALKQKRKAVILAHYYVADEVQEIADYTGDSYALAKKAAGLPCDVIVFCGVRFMGESAKLLSPEKTVYLPAPKADCPMAHMASVAEIERVRREVDDLAVVAYVNSTAELKAHSDVCVTSSNAVRIVKALPQKNIYFIPDDNLGRFVKEQVPEKNFISCGGFCPRHNAVTKEDVLRAKAEHPSALVLVHPECRKEVVELADFVGSTAEILDYAHKSGEKQFIIGTEMGIFYRLTQDNPDKEFFLMSDRLLCPNMKLITLQSVLDALEGKVPEVPLPDRADEARAPLQEMLRLWK